MNKATKQEKDTQSEAEYERQWNLQLADELAEFIGEGVYPMDVWQLVVDTLKTMADRNGIGFNDQVFVKAVVPILIERNEDNREGIICMLEAIRKKRAFDSRLKTEKQSDAPAAAAKSSDQDLEDLAELLSKAMKHPKMPDRLYNVITDELTESPFNTDSPEWILINLKSQLKQEREVGND